MTISLCMIVRNETDFLQGAVASARPLVDEVVIVDTGSTDGTVEIAWKLADAFAEVSFDGDFSSARNEAIARASCDWILFLDADERLIEPDGSRLAQQLNDLNEDVLGLRLLRYNFFADGKFYTGRELKVFRNEPSVCYERKINESVAPSIAAAGGRVVHAPVIMNHFGHCRRVAQRDAKAYHYLALMESQLRDRPNDAVLLGYQGLILRSLGRFDEAIDRSNRSIALDQNSSTVWLFRGHVLRSLGRDGEALEAYQRGLSVDPGNAALHNMAGVELLVLGQIADAAESFRAARSYDSELAHTDINLGLIAQAAENWDEAIAHFNLAGERNPGFFHDDFIGRLERDPFRAFYNETILGYAGLGYHLGYCVQRSTTGLRPSGR